MQPVVVNFNKCFLSRGVERKMETMAYSKLKTANANGRLFSSCYLLAFLPSEQVIGGAPAVGWLSCCPWGKWNRAWVQRASGAMLTGS